MNETPKPVPAAANPTSRLLGLAFIGVVVLAFIGVVVTVLFRWPPQGPSQKDAKSTPTESNLPSPQVKALPKPEDVAKLHLSKAEQEAEQVIEEHVKSLNIFFTDSKKNTYVFAGEMLSFRSKLLLVSDSISKTGRRYEEVKDTWWVRAIQYASPIYTTIPTFPINPLALAAEQAAKLKDDRHKIFISEKFKEHIFKPAQLEDAVKQEVKSYLAHMRNIESKMLVNMRADIADIPATYPLAKLDDKQLQEAYDQVLSRTISATGSDLRNDIAKQLVSFIAGEVLVLVAVRLGVSAGILGVGTTTGPATLGITVIVSLIVEQIVSLVWDWWADPKSDLATELNRKIDEMNRVTVDGLRNRLLQFSRERATSRKAAVLSLLQPTSGEAK